MTLSSATETEERYPALFMGIDGGGSSCRAKLVSLDGKITGFGKSGRANPAHGIEKSIESIIDSSQQAIKDAGLEPNAIGNISVGLGIAGVNLPSLYDKISRWRHPFKEIFLTTDLEIACLGAHAAQNGSIIIVGTGSSGISLFDSTTLIYGAHGFPLGDQGSGAWLGLQAISASLLAYDDLGPKTTLHERICSTLNVKANEINDKMATQPSKEFAKLARLVFEEAKSGDPVAITIIQQGAQYISNMARNIIERYPTGRLSLVGGLRSELLPWLDNDIQGKLSEPLYSPEDGAIFFVKSQTTQSQSAPYNIQNAATVNV